MKIFSAYPVKDTLEILSCNSAEKIELEILGIIHKARSKGSERFKAEDGLS